MEPSAVRRIESHGVGATGHSQFRRAWLAPEPVRVVVLVHGYAEHSGRYEYVGTRLAMAGSAVHAYDQQGHGRSGGARCHVRRFDDLLDDLDAVVEQARAEHPGLPLFVVGHSMGGLVVTAWGRERQPDVAGLATSGPALALSDVPRGRLLLAKVLRRVAPRLSIASDLDPDALSRDPAVVRAYLDDPLVERKMTLSFAAELMSAIERNADGGAEIRVPMLMLHGGADALCPASGSERFFAQLTVEPKQLHVYPELRHEIFNEPERDAVLDDLISWMHKVEGGAA